MNLRKFEEKDRNRLEEMFLDNLSRQSEYISHGEIQMGISNDGVTLAPGYEQRWRDYLLRQTAGSSVRVVENDGWIEGFIIFGIESDNTLPFGVVYDLLVSEESRGKGVAKILLDAALEEFATRGISDCYLESGRDNHGAHSFFEKHGFNHVSNIYRLGGITKK